MWCIQRNLQQVIEDCFAPRHGIIPEYIMELWHWAKFVKECAVQVVVANTEGQEGKHVETRGSSAERVGELDFDFLRLQRKTVLNQEEVLQKLMKNKFVDTDTMNYLRCVERSEFTSCCATHLIQGVNIATVRVSFTPSLWKIDSGPEADHFGADVGVDILDQVFVYLVPDLCCVVRSEELT